jgi:hypothetical protein
MCINKKEAENDTLLNEKIYNALSKEEKEQVQVYTNNNYILENMSSLRFAVCWRYHAHILSIIYNIPFISLSNTPKVLALLADNNLDALLLVDSKLSTNAFNHLLENEVQLKEQLKEVHKACASEAKRYKEMTLYLQKYNEKTYYINETDALLIYSTIGKKYRELCLNYTTQTKNNTLTYENKAMLILFLLLRTLSSEYAYGLSEKIKELSEKKYNNKNHNIATVAPVIVLLKEDILWLINDCIQKNNGLFYDTVKSYILKEFEETVKEETNKYNINYIDQNEYKMIHLFHFYKLPLVILIPM